MTSCKFVILKIKSIILPAIVCLFALCLVLFSENNLIAAKSGLLLWANNVVPSLLPFFIATELLGYTNVISVLGKYLNKIMRPVFRVPGEGSFPLLMGILSGYPVGAKIVANFKEKGICNNIECERLIAFTNNSGPLFIIGTVGVGFFCNTLTGILLFLTHLLSALTVGFLFRWWGISKENTLRYSVDNETNNQLQISNLGEVLSKSILNSINTILIIGGFVVLFSIIISILEKSCVLNLVSRVIFPVLYCIGIPNIYSYGLISGFLEITNGIYVLSSIAVKSISTNIVLCSFLLGFGGISVLLQVLSITSKASISIKPYFVGKMLQGVFAVLYTFLFLKYIPVFSLDLF